VTPQEFSAALSHHSFLEGLSATHKEMVAQCARWAVAPAGSYLFREGGAADACFLVHRGRVAIEINAPKRGGVCVQTIGPGDVVGWSWLTQPYRWQFDARAVEAVEAIALDAAGLRDRMTADCNLGFHLLQRMFGVIAGRLAATRLQLLDVYK
jgi:CRP/FNR family transcriptional regulator, cyclic AMP receptor protein